MIRVALVACSASKVVVPPGQLVPAADLYMASDLFRKARAYAERVAPRWAILSARYGLVDPGQLVATYEDSLTKMPARQRDAWARHVAGELARAFGPSAHYVLLAGELYRAPFVRGLVPGTWEAPMVGLGIGQQKAWLAAQLRGRP